MSSSTALKFIKHEGVWPFKFMFELIICQVVINFRCFEKETIILNPLKEAIFDRSTCIGCSVSYVCMRIYNKENGE